MEASRSATMGSGDMIVDGERDEFTCIICLEGPRDSVVTSCGHLFCWSCLYNWKKKYPVKPCPMCKIRLKQDNIIPIYQCENGSSSSSGSRASSSIPPRPSAPLRSAGDCGDSGATESPSDLQEAHDHGRHLEFLRSRAQAEFRAIREFHSPSSGAWTDEAFDSWTGREPTAPDPLHDSEFMGNVLDAFDLVFQPWSIGRFQSSWVAYYAAVNPETPGPQQNLAFFEAWCSHFYQVWNRAGRPRDMSSESHEPATTTSPEGESSSPIARGDPDVFMCSICQDSPRDSVVVSCGHLFCWSCLYTSTMENPEKECPMCKIKFGNGDIIPIYGSSSSSAHGSLPARHGAPLGTPRRDS